MRVIATAGHVDHGKSSLVLALTIIPLLSDQFLTAADAEHDAKAAPRGLFAKFGTAIDSLSEHYERALGRVLHHPRLMIAAALLLVGLGGGAYLLVGTGFLPDMDEGAFILDFWSPGGTSLAETDRQLHTIEGILAETPEILGTSRRLGGEDVKVIVRSGFEEMKASPWEKEDAQHEDIPIINYHVPKAFVLDGATLVGMSDPPRRPRHPNHPAAIRGSRRRS